MRRSRWHLALLLLCVFLFIVLSDSTLWPSLYVGFYWSCSSYTVTYYINDGNSNLPRSTTYYDCEPVYYYYYYDGGGGGGGDPTDPGQDPGGGGGTTQNPYDTNNNGIIDCYKNRIIRMDGLTITSVFGVVRADGSTHKGIDIAAVGCDGKEIYAAASGTVLQVGFEDGGWGHYIKIKDSNGLTWVYAHLKGNPTKDSSQYGVGIQINQAVIPGQTKIGICDNTGNSSGSHLHLEVRDSAWSAVDPMTKVGDC